MNKIFQEYLDQCSGLVIFTFGSDAVWYARKGQIKKENSPYQISPVDTTRAGDSFRDAIIYGLPQGWDDDATIDFASAVATCVCLTLPHALNVPGLDGIRKFMKENKK